MRPNNGKSNKVQACQASQATTGIAENAVSSATQVLVTVDRPDVALVRGLSGLIGGRSVVSVDLQLQKNRVLQKEANLTSPEGSRTAQTALRSCCR